MSLSDSAADSSTPAPGIEPSPGPSTQSNAANQPPITLVSDGTITPLSASQAAAQELKAQHELYLHRVLVGVDQLLNVLTDGDPDETISSRAARAAEAGKSWGITLSSILDKFQSDHGAKAQAGDLERAQAVTQLESTSGALQGIHLSAPHVLL